MLCVRDWLRARKTEASVVGIPWLGGLAVGGGCVWRGSGEERMGVLGEGV